MSDVNASGWMPIATCPPFEFDKENWFSNGPRYLLWSGRCTIGSYGYTEKGKGRWQSHYGIIHPTHWMPLPDAPKVEMNDERKSASF